MISSPPAGKPVKAHPLWQQALERLLADIRGGKLTSGQRIVEAQLQRELRVSRNPIREAVRQLEQRHILEYRPNIGAVVAGFSREDAAIIAENRIFLEQKAIQLVFEHQGHEKLAVLEDIIDDMTVPRDDDTIQSVERADYEFHAGLVHAAENPMLQKLWETLDPVTKMIIYTWRVRRGSFSEDREVESRSHRELLGIIRGSTLADATSAISDHIMRSWRTAIRADGRQEPSGSEPT